MAFMNYFLFKEAGFIPQKHTGFLSRCAVFSFCINPPSHYSLHRYPLPTHTLYNNITRSLQLVVLRSNQIFIAWNCCYIFTGKITTTLFWHHRLIGSLEQKTYRNIIPPIYYMILQAFEPALESRKARLQSPSPQGSWLEQISIPYSLQANRKKSHRYVEHNIRHLTDMFFWFSLHWNAIPPQKRMYVISCRTHVCTCTVLSPTILHFVLYIQHTYGYI